MAGAFTKDSRIFTLPKDADKGTAYVCPDPECGKQVVLCKGAVVKPYFRHNRIDTCGYFAGPNESQTHLQAKLLLQHIFAKRNIQWTRTCSDCNVQEDSVIERTEGDRMDIEKRFEWNGLKIADLALVSCPPTEREITCIIEVCHTHATLETDRPEPWIEVNAKTILESSIDSLDKLRCIRRYTCWNCKNQHIVNRAEKLSEGLTKSADKHCYLVELQENSDNIDLFIRYRLGQRVFMNKEGVFSLDCKITDECGEECNKECGKSCRGCYYLDDDEDDYNGDCPENAKMLNLFNDVWDVYNMKAIIRSWKSCVTAAFLHKSSNIDFSGIRSLEECPGYVNCEKWTGTFADEIIRGLIQHVVGFHLIAKLH